MQKNYQCIFFDLDHTLWDYETNSANTLMEMFELFNLQACDFSFGDFLHHFREVNHHLWNLYDHGKIDSSAIRQNRFVLILDKLNVQSEKLARDLSDYYLKECPKKTALMPGAMETLQHLTVKYRLTVVTNGFDEIQFTKLSSAGLLPFFEHIVTSEKAGHKKPAREIFIYALQQNNITAADALMVGDNPLTDIAGASCAAIDAILFNPEKVAHQCNPLHEINHLSELRSLL